MGNIIQMPITPQIPNQIETFKQLQKESKRENNFMKNSIVKQNYRIKSLTGLHINKQTIIKPTKNKFR
jgi:hypothetical protein